MPAEIIVNLQTLAELLHADAALAWHPRGPSSSRIAGCWPEGLVSSGATWPAIGSATSAASPIADPSAIGQLLPAAFRLGVPGPIRGAWPHPIGELGAGVMLVWWSTDPPPRIEVDDVAEGPLRAAIEAQLRRLRADADAALLESLEATLPQAIVFVDDGGGYGRVNAAAATLLGLTAGEASSATIGAALGQLRLRSRDPQALEQRAQQLFTGPNARISGWIWEFDAPPTDLRVSTVPVRGEAVSGRLWVLDDVSSQMELVRVAEQARAAADRARRELAASEERFRMALHGAASGILLADPDGIITTVNPALCAMLDAPSSYLVGRGWREVATGGDDRAGTRLSALAAGTTDTVRLDTTLTRTDGTTILADTSVAAVRDADGGLRQLVVQFSDVTDVRASHADLAHRVGHDPLTGLANRTGLQTWLERTLEAPDAQVGVLFCDLDGFKGVNDTWGHAAGDAVLVTIADRLRRSVRVDDLVARLGGDEFVVALSGASRPTITAIADGVRRSVAEPIPLPDFDTVAHVGVSIGATAGPGPADELLARADAAVYRAKEGGRNRVEWG